MTRSPLLAGALASLIAAVSPVGAHLRAEGKKERPPRRWSVQVVEKVRPAVVIVHSIRKADTRSGLGILIDARGIVVMPRRLVAGACQIEVVGGDGRKLTPKTVLSDAGDELAVVRLKGCGPFPHASFGDSDALKVGDAVLSLDLMFREISFEVGLFTGKGRPGRKGAGLLHMDSVRSYPCDRDLLLNRKGEVVGIWAGSGAVPSDRVKECVRRLLKDE